MRNLLFIIVVLLGFDVIAQNAQETNMVTLVNQVRTNPKSFIPVVEEYIKNLETTNEPFSNIKINGSTTIKKTNNSKSVVNPLISEAKDLITFLSSVKSVKTLTPCKKLFVSAKEQSVYLDSIKMLTHSGPNGVSSTTRFTKEFNLSGENCVIGKNETEALLMLLIDNGNKSKGHRKAIFSNEFTKIGVGNTNEYWVQDFGY